MGEEQRMVVSRDDGRREIVKKDGGEQKGRHGSWRKKEKRLILQKKK